MASPKLLLLQARDEGDPSREEERLQFALRTGLSESSIDSWQLVEGAPTLEAVRSHDGLLVGGAGDYFVTRNNLPHQQATFDFLREVVARGRPMYASCFGFHLLSAALGGDIVHEPESMELGTYTITMSKEGQEDELFGRLPPQCKAQIGHKDHVTKLPPGALHLASSELCDHQALRFAGAPVWASQFHPELDDRDVRRRIDRYIAEYGKQLSPREILEARDSCVPSPEVNQLLVWFVELVWG